MTRIARFVVLVAGLALAGTPAFAAGPPSDTPNRDDNPGIEHRPSETPPANQGTEHRPATPGPKAGLPAKAKAYGER